MKKTEEFYNDILETLEGKIPIFEYDDDMISLDQLMRMKDEDEKGIQAKKFVGNVDVKEAYGEIEDANDEFDIGDIKGKVTDVNDDMIAKGKRELYDDMITADDDKNYQKLIGHIPEPNRDNGEPKVNAKKTYESYANESSNTLDYFYEKDGDEDEDIMVCELCGKEFNEIEFGLEDGKDHLYDKHGIISFIDESYSSEGVNTELLSTDDGIRKWLSNFGASSEFVEYVLRFPNATSVRQWKNSWEMGFRDWGGHFGSALFDGDMDTALMYADSENFANLISMGYGSQNPIKEYYDTESIYSELGDIGSYIDRVIPEKKKKEDDESVYSQYGDINDYIDRVIPEKKKKEDDESVYSQYGDINDYIDRVIPSNKKDDGEAEDKLYDTTEESYAKEVDVDEVYEDWISGDFKSGTENDWYGYAESKGVSFYDALDKWAKEEGEESYSNEGFHCNECDEWIPTSWRKHHQEKHYFNPDKKNVAEEDDAEYDFEELSSLAQDNILDADITPEQWNETPKDEREKLEQEIVKTESHSEEDFMGDVWACPECGFKTISKDEYDDHVLAHGDALESYNEDQISKPNSDENILSKFRT
jgi:hypothetical protein